MPLLLVRHAVAQPRRAWADDDDARPLNDRGRRQAEGLVDLLSPFAITRVASSPAIRCTATVAPLSVARDLKVKRDDTLAEGNGEQAVTLVGSLLAGGFGSRKGGAVVLCTHGDVIPEVLWALEAEGADLGDDGRCQKGSTWVLEERRGGIRGRYLPPPA